MTNSPDQHIPGNVWTRLIAAPIADMGIEMDILQALGGSHIATVTGNYPEGNTQITLADSKGNVIVSLRLRRKEQP